MSENLGSRRAGSDNSRMHRRTAHGDVTGVTVLYALLLALIVAGRFGWLGLAVYALVVGPLTGWWVARRVEERRRM